MSTYRMVNTRFWEDGFIESLDPIEKLVFIYYLTNSSTNACGIYECSSKKIAFGTGLDKEKVEVITERFKGRIHLIDGWIYLRNFLKYQSMKSDAFRKGVENELEKVPTTIKQKILNIDKRYKKGVSHFLTFSQEDIEKEKKNKKDEELKLDKQIDEVIEFYKGKICDDIRITKQSRNKVATRLKEYKVEELKKAINKFAGNQWRMEKNKTLGLQFFFRSEDQIAKWLTLEQDRKEKIKI